MVARIAVVDVGADRGLDIVDAVERAASDCLFFFRPVGRTLVEHTIAFTVTPHVSEIDRKNFLPSSRPVAYTRQAWSAAGVYPEWLDCCEDLLLDLKLKSLGCTFEFTDRAVAPRSARPSVPALMKQYYRYARGDGKARQWGKRYLARYGAYFVGLVLLALSVVHPWILVTLAIRGVSWVAFLASRTSGPDSGTAVVALAERFS